MARPVHGVTGHKQRTQYSREVKMEYVSANWDMSGYGPKDIVGIWNEAVAKCGLPIYITTVGGTQAYFANQPVGPEIWKKRAGPDDEAAVEGPYVSFKHWLDEQMGAFFQEDELDEYMALIKPSPKGWEKVE